MDSRFGSSTEVTSLVDIPEVSGGSPEAIANFIMNFETCARCDDNGEYFGCVTWGWSGDGTGGVTLKKPGGADSPSETFKAAIRTFDKFYGTKWGEGN